MNRISNNHRNVPGYRSAARLILSVKLPARFRSLFSAVLIGLLSLPLSGHVGSPGVLYEGQAGAYRILVNVNPPDVIPGTAQVSVFVAGEGVKRVTVRPIHFLSGDEGAPSADELTPVPGELGHYQGIAWLMRSGSFSVQIGVEGSAGAGLADVPVTGVITAQRDMPPQLGWILAGLAALLFVLMITIIGASVSDGLLKPGLALDTRLKRKRWLTMGIAAALGGLILYGGSAWWNSWAADYRQYMYKPIQAMSSVAVHNGQREFRLQVDTTRWQERANQTNLLIPDHGKLMHLFLVRQPDMDAFAHLHPDRTDSTTFTTPLPALPPGQYWVFADIVHRSGFTETITSEVQIPTAAFMANDGDTSPADPEDTYVITNPLKAKQVLLADANSVLCGAPGVKTRLSDGSSVVWEQSPDTPLTAGRIHNLTFSVQDPDGQPATLEPYLGMQGHAVVMREDASVFIHLHPVGTYSMAARQSLENRIADTVHLAPKVNPQAFRDSVDRVVAQLKTMTEAEKMAVLMPAMNHELTTNSQHGEHAGSVVTFPYVFPQPGNYRIWVQVKRAGKVLSGAFDAQVN